MKSAFVLAFVLATPLLGMNLSFSKPHQESTWAQLPPEIRPLLHMSTKDVPPYPEANDSLMNVRWWPAIRVFDGVIYAREFAVSHSDMVTLNLASLVGIDSGYDYGSHYVTYSKDGKRSGGRGPSYHWRSDSTLAGRDYLTPAGGRAWSYTHKGALWSFREVNYGDTLGTYKGDLWKYSFGGDDHVDTLGTYVSEYFGADGSLVGFAISAPELLPDSRGQYWMGSKRGREEWNRLYLDWWTHH